MNPVMGKFAVIFLAIFLVAYALAALGVPLGVVVPILALADAVLILIGK